jgi:integrase
MHKALFKILFLEGMRVNELLALQVKDVSLNFNKITISKSYGMLKSGKYGITTPKNKYSNRIIDMLNDTKVILQQHIKLNKLKQNDYIFYGSQPLGCTDLIYHFHKVFPELNLHSLRHSNISWLLSLGVDTMYIAKRVGHKDTTQIIKTYGHWYEDRKFDMLNVINNSSRDTTVILKKSKNSIK